jgi:Ca2+-binding EF-hand superfamily protein
MKGDYDEDGSVTFNDLNAFLAALNDSGANLNPTDVWKGDYDNDGSVTFNDLNAFLTSLALP